MALTDTTIRLPKASELDRKLSDGKGLYLLVTATGSKLWRLKYRAVGKELAQPLQGALVSPNAKHHAAITEPVAFGGLRRAIEDHSGQPVTTLAQRFTAHVSQRPGEVRQAEWSEINLDKALWTIPAACMKQRQPHRVPLSSKPWRCCARRTR